MCVDRLKSGRGFASVVQASIGFVVIVCYRGACKSICRTCEQRFRTGGAGQVSGMDVHMRTVEFTTGETIPALGLGTWHMGERAADKQNEINVLQAGLAAGLQLIDTAEMYADGGAEEVVGEALAGRRQQAFVVSKVYPHNAGARQAVLACERSLKRLKTDRIDLYLLHWRGTVPLAETVAAFEKLKQAGKIRHWGVSNFDVADMKELSSIAPRDACAANQILYHAGERGIEFDLLPYLAQTRCVGMAYSPLGQGDILNDPALVKRAAMHGVSTATIALAWALRHPQMIAIPKTSSLVHLREILAARRFSLSPEDTESLDQSFPPPKRKTPLQMI